MYLRRTLGVVFGLTFSTTVSAQDWRILEGTKSFGIKTDARYSTAPSERDFSYNAFRFDRVDYEYDLVHLDDLLKESYPELTSDYIAYNEDTDSSRVVRPSMSEAWRYFENDNSVVALVPFGFSEIAGEPNIVGFRKRDGKVENGIFASPNLDTIFCLDDSNEHNRRAELGVPAYPGQIPILFPVEFSNRVNYQYIEGTDIIDLGTSYDPNRFKDTFEECQNMIQIGYQIIAPRDRSIDKDSKGRISNGNASLRKLKAFDRVVMSYDRFGFLNFVRSDGPSHVHDFGVLLSSDAYYDNKTCRYRENPNYPARSLSCELWAVTVSAFDGAAIYLRDDETGEPTVWGDGERTTPAVLVIRDRSVLETLRSSVAKPDSDKSSPVSQ